MRTTPQPSSTGGLELCDVHVRRAGRTILSGAHLRLGPGDRVAVVGPNGSGKTTLLKVALGRMIPDAGSVRVGGHDIRALRPRQRAARMAWLPQHDAVEEPIVAVDLVATARYRFGEPWPGRSGKPTVCSNGWGLPAWPSGRFLRCRAASDNSARRERAARARRSAGRQRPGGDGRLCRGSTQADRCGRPVPRPGEPAARRPLCSAPNRDPPRGRHPGNRNGTRAGIRRAGRWAIRRSRRSDRPVDRARPRRGHPRRAGEARQAADDRRPRRRHRIRLRSRTGSQPCKAGSARGHRRGGERRGGGERCRDPGRRARPRARRGAHVADRACVDAERKGRGGPRADPVRTGGPCAGRGGSTAQQRSADAQAPQGRCHRRQKPRGPRASRRSRLPRSRRAPSSRRARRRPSSRRSRRTCRRRSSRPSP